MAGVFGRWFAVLVVAGAFLAPSPVRSAPAALVAPAGSAAVAVVPTAGLELRGATWLSPRLEELRLYSPALAREVTARVLVPAGFDAARDRLPVLWLLHGGFGSAPDWTEVGDAERLTADLPLIVVMPEGGTGGWYADWHNDTAEGPQRWETHHLDELRPFVEQRYGTRVDRAGRAVAGLSMGGFGAIHYAARHPDLFGLAAAFSGAVDNLHPGVSAVVSASPLAHDGVPGDVFGQRVANESRWRADNPVDLAGNLRTVEVQIRTGNGQRGGPHGGGPDPIEMGCWQASTTLHERLDQLGIPHLFEDRGPGAHTWPYWQDDLTATLPRVVARAAEGAVVPSVVEHLALEPAFSVWGFDVALDRPVYESAVLTARPRGFDLSGSGPGTVTTPAWYEPAQAVRATITSSGAATAVADLVADGQGRVAVPVDLGPASVVDEYPAGGLVRAAVEVSVDLAPR